MLPNSSDRALKEWAVVVRALEAGQQLVILRKGGVSETGNEFRIEHPEFLFYPTYEHQKSESILPAFAPALERVLAETPAAGTIQVSSYARVTASFDIRTETQLAALRPYHIWSDGYALERLRWRPTKPLAAIALRVYRLAEPVILLFHASYRGCTSWITLERPIALAGAMPVLDQSDYDEQVATLGTALERAGLITESVS